MAYVQAVRDQDGQTDPAELDPNRTGLRLAFASVPLLHSPALRSNPTAVLTAEPVAAARRFWVEAARDRGSVRESGESSRANRIEENGIRPDRIKTNRIKLKQIKPDQIQSNRSKSNIIKSKPANIKSKSGKCDRKVNILPRKRPDSYKCEHKVNILSVSSPFFTFFAKNVFIKATF